VTRNWGIIGAEYDLFRIAVGYGEEPQFSALRSPTRDVTVGEVRPVFRAIVNRIRNDGILPRPHQTGDQFVGGIRPVGCGGERRWVPFRDIIDDRRCVMGNVWLNEEDPEEFARWKREEAGDALQQVRAGFLHVIEEMLRDMVGVSDEAKMHVHG
jgi:hypothetical protein